MAALILRRILWMIPILFGVSVICFAMLHRAPGDPVSAMVVDARERGQPLSRDDRERLRIQYGLDKPVYRQYVDWASLVVRGDFGTSTRQNQAVRDVILQRLPNTLKLTGIALTLTIVLALPLGILSAAKPHSRIDHLLTTVSFMGISIPQFWLALMLLYLFGVTLGWFPVRGMSSPYADPGVLSQFRDAIAHYVLPVAAITLVSLAGFLRHQRAAMLEVIRQDFVQTARAKGVAEWRVLLVHVWPNALLPMITLLGYMLVILVEGSIVIESIFSWPGMGQLTVVSLAQRDYPVVMAIVLLSAIAVLIGNLIADILYAVADPRVRYDR